MQYPYTTLLETVTVFLTLFIGIVIFCFIIKKWQGAQLLTAFKAIIIYELASFLFYLVYPFPLLSKISKIGVFKILDVLFFGIVLFFIFYFVMNKILAINLKKSLIVFLLVIIIIFPLLDFFRVRLEKEIWLMNLPVFEKENLEIEKQMEICMKNLLICLSRGFPEPLPLKIIGKIDGGMLSWPSSRIRDTYQTGFNIVQ